MNYETWVKGNERVVIDYDQDAEDPRVWQSEETTLVAKHKRYKLGDREPLSDNEWKERQEDEKLVVLPVYMYEHSGIRLATGHFDCPWDSGQLGFIFAEKQGTETREDTKERLREEVRLYSLYLEGVVFHFRREIKIQCEHCNHVKWEHIDSCGGYIGYPDSEDSNIYEDAFPDGREGWELAKEG